MPFTSIYSKELCPFEHGVACQTELDVEVPPRNLDTCFFNLLAFKKPRFLPSGRRRKESLKRTEDSLERASELATIRQGALRQGVKHEKSHDMFERGLLRVGCHIANMALVSETKSRPVEASRRRQWTQAAPVNSPTGSDLVPRVRSGLADNLERQKSPPECHRCGPRDGPGDWIARKNQCPYIKYYYT